MLIQKPLPHSRPLQRGVTLVELMVGMVIGLLAVLVMVEVGRVYEGQKRSTTSGTDAQVNAALALYTLQRDIQMGGYGLTSHESGLGCAIKAKHGTNTFNWSVTPVFITDGANGTPDTVEVTMSTNRNFSVPIRIRAQHRRDADYFELDERTNIGNLKGDLMLAVPRVPSSTAWCSVFNVSEDPATTGNTIRHAAGVDGPWNQDSTATIFPGTSNSDISYTTDDYLINLGRLSNRTYSVSTTHKLQVQAFSTDAVASSTEDLFPNVVNMQAVYGKDTNNDKVPDTWNAVQPASPAEWKQVIAVRLAIVTRSTQYEKEAVTTSEPAWKPDGATAEVIKIEGLADWQHYRYKVFETVIPLRNVIWQS
jgi:type IV pilus assembly protein PilW